jgi:hypothetical protein
MARMTTLAMIASALAVGACTRTFQAAVVQPNPLVTMETLRKSEKAVIVTGDMELRLPHQPGPAQRAAPVRTARYPLHNEASFTLVSRDRLRFHVQLEHKWQEWADLRTWEVEYVDSAGNHYRPEAVEHPTTKHLVTMWDTEVRSARRNLYGDIVALNDDGWRRRQPLGSLSVFRGKADFVFYRRDLFTKQLTWVKLIVRRRGQAFEFVWNFRDRDQPRWADATDALD